MADVNLILAIEEARITVRVATPVQLGLFAPVADFAVFIAADKEILKIAIGNVPHR